MSHMFKNDGKYRIGFKRQRDIVNEIIVYVQTSDYTSKRLEHEVRVVYLHFITEV